MTKGEVNFTIQQDDIIRPTSISPSPSCSLFCPRRHLSFPLLFTAAYLYFILLPTLPFTGSRKNGTCLLFLSFLSVCYSSFALPLTSTVYLLFLDANLFMNQCDVFLVASLHFGCTSVAFSGFSDLDKLRVI